MYSGDWWLWYTGLRFPGISKHYKLSHSIRLARLLTCFEHLQIFTNDIFIGLMILFPEALERVSAFQALVSARTELTELGQIDVDQ